MEAASKSDSGAIIDLAAVSDGEDTNSAVTVTPRPTPTPNKRSPIWAYFSPNPDITRKDWVVCDLCLPVIKEVKTKDSSTSNLKTHLLHNHPAAHAELKNQTRASTSTPCSESTMTPYLAKKRKSEYQPTIAETVSRTSKYSTDSNKHKAITSKLTCLLVKQMLPSTLVESEEWIDLLQELNCQYVCPGRKHFSDKAIPSLYSHVKSVVMRDLQTASGISCTTDGWSSVTTDPYVSLTVHFLTPTYILKSYCLRTIYLPESHTADNIAVMIRGVLAEYDLYIDDIVTFTTDNAANMKAAARVLNVVRIPCFGHILHNAINKALEDQPTIETMVKACRTMVSTLHHSFK